MIHNILVPVDFSSASKNAMDYAIFMAEKLKASITILHSFHTTTAEAISDAWKIAFNETLSHTRQDSRAELDAWLQALRDTRPGLKCSAMYMDGNLEENTAALALKKEIDLVVMGTDGAHTFSELLAGSHTARVMEKVKCPVLAVPALFKLQVLDKMVYATNYMEGDENLISELAGLAKIFGAELIVVHVVNEDLSEGADECLSESYVEGLSMETGYDKLKFQCIKSRDPYDELTRLAESSLADLIAICHRDRNTISAFLEKGMARKLVHRSEIPLLVFHPLQDDRPTNLRFDF